jgi:glycogen synthase
MKILMFGWEFPPHNSGGLGVACFGLSKALASSGQEITFVLPRKVNVSSDFAKMIFAEGTDIKIKHVDSILRPYLGSDEYDRELKTVGATIYGRDLFEEVERYGFAALGIAENQDFDIIHAHDWLSFKAGVAAKKATGKPLIVHIHATTFDICGGSSFDQRVYDIEKEGMTHADKVIAVSNYTKNIIVDKYGIDPNKIEVIHNGIDSHEYDSHPTDESINSIKHSGNKVVIFIGRLTVQKGPDYFIRAAKQVLDFYPKVTFVIGGSGDMEHQLIQEAAELGISDKVLFAGFLRGEELNRLYKMADLFVMPSVSEPFGLTALESAANGTPVLVSKQSGVSEVLTHALKADFWDVEEMTNKILAVLHYDSLKTTLKENGKAESKNHNWKRAASKCVEIYKNVLNNFFPKSITS